jgi:hypothetical protein
MKANKTEKENGRYAPTKSLTDENGKPLEWEFRHITSRQSERIRDENSYDVQITGKPNQYRTKLNTAKYLSNLIAESTVVPNLNNKDLQDSYGVKNANDLLYELVDDPGEYAELCTWIQRFQGFTQTLDEQVQEAKNS